MLVGKVLRTFQNSRGIPTFGLFSPLEFIYPAPDHGQFPLFLLSQAQELIGEGLIGVGGFPKKCVQTGLHIGCLPDEFPPFCFGVRDVLGRRVPQVHDGPIIDPLGKRRLDQRGNDLVFDDRFGGALEKSVSICESTFGVLHWLAAPVQHLLDPGPGLPIDTWCVLAFVGLIARQDRTDMITSVGESLFIEPEGGGLDVALKVGDLIEQALVL